MIKKYFIEETLPENKRKVVVCVSEGREQIDDFCRKKGFQIAESFFHNNYFSDKKGNNILAYAIKKFKGKAKLKNGDTYSEEIGRKIASLKESISYNKVIIHDLNFVKNEMEREIKGIKEEIKKIENYNEMSYAKIKEIGK